VTSLNERAARYPKRTATLLLIAASALLTACATNATNESGEEKMTNQDYLYGITIDRVDALDQTVEVIESLPYPVTARIVYDEEMPAQEYIQTTERIAEVGSVMGGLLDSLYIKDFSEAAYADRAEEYVSALGSHVDIWEIGNEVNGEWTIATGEDTSAVSRKIQAAHDIVHKHGGKSALTLHYNENCWDKPEHEVFSWTDAHLSPDLRSELEYVFISYYRENCEGIEPNWQNVFERLRGKFPKAKLGFGEAGVLRGGKDEKAKRIKQYYELDVRVDGYVGGVFWWYFWSDVIQPYSKGDRELYDVFQNLHQ
jgi:hypothetical protein